MHVKKGDNVIVTTGKDKGKSGTIEASFPKKNMVLVSGVNLKKKHMRAKTAEGKGQIVDKAMPIHVSNVKLSGAKAPSRPKAVKAPAKKSK